MHDREGMRTASSIALAVIGLAACGRHAEPALSTHPRGYAARMQDAEAHSQLAERHRQAAGAPELSTHPEDYQCGAIDMSDQLTSGGQRLEAPVPCWNPREEFAERHRAAAAREQLRARSERRAATRLVEAELAACRGISAAETEHSPFVHHSAIAEVIPHREGDNVRGVRVVFRPVPGLTAAWLTQAIACHRARFERLGQPASYLPDDPTLVAGTTTTVASRNGHVEVLVEARDPIAARAALGRAEDLARAHTAGR